MLDRSDIENLPYRELQQLCKTEGVNAKGKTEELVERLLAHRNGSDVATPRRLTQRSDNGRTASDTTPITPRGGDASPQTPQRGRPRNLARSLTPTDRANLKSQVAKAKIAAASITPLPPDERPSPSPSRSRRRSLSVAGSEHLYAPKLNAWQQRRGELKHVGLFALISGLLSLLCAYTMRLNARALSSAFSADTRTLGGELAQQWRHLFHEDVRSAHDAWRSGVAGGRTAVDLTKFAAGRWLDHAQGMLPHVTPGGTATVPAPLRGLNVTDDLAARLFSKAGGGRGGAGREARADAERFAFEASQIYGRSRAPAYVVMHSADVSSEDAAAEILQAFAEVPPGRAACMHIDIAQLPPGGEQGPRLHELAAAQLAAQQASLVVVTNADQLSTSGLSVFLQLIGDETRLNTHEKDVPTKYATVLILQREGTLYGAAAIERAVAERADATAATALRRRISATVLELNSATATAARTARERAAAEAAVQRRARELKLAAEIEAADAAQRQHAARAAAEAAGHGPDAASAQNGPAGSADRDEL